MKRDHDVAGENHQGEIREDVDYVKDVPESCLHWSAKRFLDGFTITAYFVKAFGSKHVPGGGHLAGESDRDEFCCRPDGDESTQGVPEQTVRSLTGDQIQKKNDGQFGKAECRDEE